MPVLAYNGGTMFELTKRAAQRMQEYFEEKGLIPSIRIVMMKGG